MGAVLAALTGCTSAADTASRNIGTASENFEVQRTIVFYNAITDKQMFVIEGRCSVETSEGDLGGALEVTCKVAENQYEKAFLGLADNVSFMVIQADPIDVSVYHTRYIMRPESAIPGFDLDMGQQ